MEVTQNTIEELKLNNDKLLQQEMKNLNEGFYEHAQECVNLLSAIDGRDISQIDLTLIENDTQLIARLLGMGSNSDNSANVALIVDVGEGTKCLYMNFNKPINDSRRLMSISSNGQRIENDFKGYLNTLTNLTVKLFKDLTLPTEKH